MRHRSPLMILPVTILLCLLAGLVYNLPPVHDRLAWRLANLQARIKYRIDPPAQVVFVPQQRVESPTQVTKPAVDLAPMLTPQGIEQPTAWPTRLAETPTALPTPAPPVTPLPGKVTLSGFRYEYQQFNNCGPANLAMALSYWGWKGDQRNTRNFLRPNKQVDDKNVNPSEMVTFVETQTHLKALVRVGGDLDMLKHFIAAKYPVIIEKGHEQPKEDWMGHYLLLTGYDDTRQRFIAQDSLIMPDFPEPYDDLLARWRDFNETYLVIYPADNQPEVLAILGPQADEAANYRYAAEKTRQEMPALQGRDLYFAWYALGSSLVGLQDYAGAADAYDRAFELYTQTTEKQRPWRMLWYQAGPYAAYFYTGRYQDVLRLGNATLATLSDPTLEEAYYWCGMARQALGDQAKAIYDFQKAVELNPNYTLAREALQRLPTPTPQPE